MAQMYVGMVSRPMVAVTEFSVSGHRPSGYPSGGVRELLPLCVTRAPGRSTQGIETLHYLLCARAKTGI